MDLQYRTGHGRTSGTTPGAARECKHRCDLRLLSSRPVLGLSHRPEAIRTLEKPPHSPFPHHTHPRDCTFCARTPSRGPRRCHSNAADAHVPDDAAASHPLSGTSRPAHAHLGPSEFRFGLGARCGILNLRARQRVRINGVLHAPGGRRGVKEHWSGGRGLAPTIEGGHASTRRSTKVRLGPNRPTLAEPSDRPNKTSFSGGNV